MFVCAGIDEAGYGPMFGPLVVGCSVFGLPGLGARDSAPDLWKLLSKAVCRDLATARRGCRGRLAVNDSKKLRTSSSGLRHLELGDLAFAALAGHQVATVDRWLDLLGESRHHQLEHLPWYAPSTARPWQALPTSVTAGEVAVARGMLTAVAKIAGVQVLDMRAKVVFEDQFNQMVGVTRSKASMNFTFVCGHLQAIWRRFGHLRPHVVVDRQSGRTYYRQLLSLNFPEAELTVVCERTERSSYFLAASGRQQRAMSITFLVDAESAHLPVALASMISKYTRELLMARFQAWFSERLPAVRPTAGYAKDAQRFWKQIRPELAGLSIQPQLLRRIS